MRRSVIALTLVLATAGTWHTAPPASAQVIESVSTGLGILTGLKEVGSWVVGAASGADKVDVVLTPSGHLDVDLGVKVQYSVEFQFDDTIRLSEYAFLETYVLLNNRVIRYNRYPETGYIANPETYFDDDYTGKIQDVVYLGAYQWPCGGSP